MFEHALEVEGLTKDYADTRAVDAVSFGLLKGEFFGLLGPNGAGKTTTISMLMGLLKPTEGRIIVNGLDFATSPLEVKARLGLVPQNLAFYQTLSARDNLLFYGRLYGLKGKLLQERISRVMEMVGLSDRLNQTVANFSNGMKRRLNIAIGLLHEPEILILDEPTIGIDTQTRVVILDGLRHLNKSGTTILYTTHYIEEAEHLCDRVAIMDQGRIIALDSPSVLIRTLGKGIIRMEFNEGVDSDALRQFEDFGSVRIVDRQKRKIHLQTARTDEALMRVMDMRENRQSLFKSIDILEPNLESVFIHLTGRRLRE